jgi:uncharacterized membrane protein
MAKPTLHVSPLERFGIVWSFAKFFFSVHLAEMVEYTIEKAEDHRKSEHNI